MLRSIIHRSYHSRRTGFTLVELLVAIALFSILVSVAAGGFVNALRAERQTAAIMAAQSNVGIALEEMAREMRTGYLFCDDIGTVTPTPSAACQPTCIVGTSAPDPNAPNTYFWDCRNFLEYYNANGERVDYSLINGILYRSDSAEDGGAAQAITGSNVSIRYLNFSIFGNIEGDHWNPRITVALGVTPDDPTINWTTAQRQTTVSARQIDCTQGANPQC
jgi:prepilin-type N-terminal cleavage/methylation domain-containing protein